MPAVVSDVLETRLELTGINTWKRGIDQATGALGVFGRELGRVSRPLGLDLDPGNAAQRTFQFLGAAAREAAQEAEQYRTAVRNFKDSFPQGEMEGFANDLSRLTGVDDGKIADLLGVLGTYQVSGGDAKALAEPILNASVALRALGLDSTAVSKTVGQALQTGDAGGLRRAGIVIADAGFKAMTTEQRVQALVKALNAQGGSTAARDFRNSWDGSIQALETAVGNFKGAFGASFVEPVTKGINLATDLINTVNGLPAGVFDTLGKGAALGAAALAAYSFKAKISSTQASLLAGENARLTNELLKSATAADHNSDEEGQAARQMGVAAEQALILTGQLRPLANAHRVAASAALRHAEAEERLGRAMGRPGANVLIPGQSRRGIGLGTPGRSTAANAAANARAAYQGEPPTNAPAPGGPLGVPSTSGTAVAGGVAAGAVAATAGKYALNAMKGQGAGMGAPSAAQTAVQAAQAGKTLSTVAKVAGNVGKVAKFAKSPVALAVGTTVGIGSSFLPEEGALGATKHVLQGATGWGATGATIGSAFGPPGALIGGAVGAAGGGIAGWMEHDANEKARAQETGAANDRGKGSTQDSALLEETRRIADGIEALRRDMKGAVSTRDVPYSQQEQLIRWGKIIG